MVKYGISNIKAFDYTNGEMKKIKEVFENEKYTKTIDKISKDLALKMGVSPDHLDQSYPNYRQPELVRMLLGKDVYRVLCGLVTGPFNKPNFSLKLEKINY